jgi:hypothetical protein
VASPEHSRFDYTYDPEKFTAFRHFYIPTDTTEVEDSLQPLVQTAPEGFLNVAQAFVKNFAAFVSTACMPFRIASANYSHRLFLQLLTAENIRNLPTGYEPESERQSEEDRQATARAAASKRFAELMASGEDRYKSGLVILADLESLLEADEMRQAAAELMRQAEVLAWSTLEVLANDLLVELLNKKPQLAEALLKDERTKKRFQTKDISSSLSAYDYDLSGHMGDVLTATMKIDDVEAMRSIYDVLMPSNPYLRALLGDAELWKLNQRRNVILHRRSIVDDAYLKNTGDSLILGSELKVTPQQFKNDLKLVILIAGAMFGGLRHII